VHVPLITVRVDGSKRWTTTGCEERSARARPTVRRPAPATAAMARVSRRWRSTTLKHPFPGYARQPESATYRSNYRPRAELTLHQMLARGHYGCRNDSSQLSDCPSSSARHSLSESPDGRSHAADQRPCGADRGRSPYRPSTFRRDWSSSYSRRFCSTNRWTRSLSSVCCSRLQESRSLHSERSVGVQAGRVGTSTTGIEAWPSTC
jgi:hypothetical protein